ncbi:MAG TPA: helix-turn-helix domain-containing protein [Verrucomicrobiae bacterium]|nr:helix-turn-helix domain-containing protein [Verrucomicrobiae bacterium]
MHSPQTRQKFVERRAQGWSLVRIAAELGVARSTLIEWSRQLRFEIQNQLAIELDDLRDRLLGPRSARAAGLAEKLAHVENELRKRDLATLSTQRLFSLSLALRREIERETEGVHFVTPVKDIPDAEYIEQVQEWKP